MIRKPRIKLSQGKDAFRYVIHDKWMKQAQVAQVLSISPATVSCLISGTRKPSRRLATRIERIFGVKASSWDSKDDNPTAKEKV